MSKMLVFHHNDLDGRCAAAIMAQHAANKGFGPIEFVEMDYKDAVDVERIGGLDTVAVVDFSFKPEVMAEVRKRA